MNRCILAIVSLFPIPVLAKDGKVTIRSDFPGGNIVVVKNEAGSVHLAPDLRGGPAWFYWHFECEAVDPGSVTFTFANPPMLGIRGPAWSRDGGKTWEWFCTDQVRLAPPPDKDQPAKRVDSFTCIFEAKQKILFAVAIPYLQHNLDAFITKHKNNPHFSRSELTKTRGNRPVDLIQVGKPGPGVSPLLLTARHHACESMASFVMEGFLEEAMSDTPLAVEFRKKYVIYAVPMVDTDGVQAGDQGKNRPPHDHNRDYGDKPIYPEIQAIQDLVKEKQVRFSMDLHCPLIRGDIHEAFHFLGLGVPQIKENLREYSEWLREERPPIAMVPIDLLTDPQKPNALNPKMNSHYLATRENAVFNVTLEIPYAQGAPIHCRDVLEANIDRDYGRAMLKAWVRTQFLSEKDMGKRDGDSHVSLATLRTEFIKLYRGKPREAEELADGILKSKTSSAILRIEANHLLAMLRLNQKRYADALTLCDKVGSDIHATNLQRVASMDLRLMIHCNDPQSTAETVERSIADLLRQPYLAMEQQAKAYESVTGFYQRNKDLHKAIQMTQRQEWFAHENDKGKLLNRIATFQEQLQLTEDATITRQQAIATLQKRLKQIPNRNIHAANMTVELFDAVMAYRRSTLEEKKAAAKQVLDHEIVPTASKDRVRKAISELEK